MTTSQCTVCTTPTTRRNGLCEMHYRRLLRKGDVGAAERMTNPAPPECVIDGCSSKPVGRGLCSKHWQTLPENKTRAAKGEPQATFEALMALPPTDECIDWPWGKDGFGYGRIWNVETGRHEGAHAVSCTLHHGPRPAGLVVCHLCRFNPACINPRHLCWDTQSRNCLDREDDKRNRPRRTGWQGFSG